MSGLSPFPSEMASSEACSGRRSFALSAPNRYFSTISLPQQQRGFKFPPLPAAALLVTVTSQPHFGSGTSVDFASFESHGSLLSP